MAEKYSSDLGLVVIAQITQNIGYSCTLSAPLELLQDIMQKFMQEFARDLHGHTEHANRIEPSLRDVYLSIKSLNINVQELLDFIGNVEPVGFTRDVPQFPIKKTMNMNFLKPGSAETLTRPVYIFEYLPPMQRTESREIQLDTQNKFSQQREKSEFEATCSVEKLGKIHNRPISPNASIFPSNTFDSEIGRSVREMSSVVMTTGGFISPAIEGKLPEAFIPDIIEKYKGLDAPPSSSIVVHPLEYSPKVLPSEIESPTIPKKSISLQYSEINNINQNTAQLSNSQNAEGSLLSPSKNLKAAIAMNAGALKKTKKQKPDLATEQCQEDKYENSSTKTISAEEKSQRKALKIFQKLSKTHSISLNGHGKKSKKKVNRGSTSSDPNKISLEKIMKKQTKHRQKAIQLELDVKNYGFMQTSQTLSGFSAESNLNSENITSTDIPSGAPLIIKQTETSSQASSSFQVHEGDLQHSEILLPARKNACEPERSKLDVFKKISKPRAPRQEGGIASGSSGLGVRVFGSTISGPPIISLPSGTTITPTPLLGLNPAKINTSYMLDQIPPSPPKVADSEMPVLESVKSRKRGRKPGGKNFVKQTSFTSQSLVESAKREKTTHVIPLPLAPPTMIISENASMTLEPLNLCNVEQASSEPLQNLHTKDKKERKKSKTKPENILELCNKVYAPEKERNILTCQDQFMPVPSPISNPSLYPGNQAGIVPMLPLLHFPPRPGLIPSGPGLFPAVTGLVGFGNPVNTVSISPFIAFSGSEGSVANAVGCPPTIDSADIDSHQILKRSTSEKNVQMERNYCNVAPLVPDSMKLAECKKVTCEKTELDNTFANATPKSKTRPLVQASGNLGDPIEVSDDSDESLQNRQPPAQRKSPQCSPGHARSSLVQSQYLSLSSISEDVCHADFKRIVPALNSSESVAKVKKPVKLNLPDVKRIIHTPSPTTFPQFQNFSNFIGGDKYSLAGGADLIPLSRVDSGSAYSSQKVPSSSLTGGASLAINPILKNFNISEEQKCLPPTSSYEDITITPTGSSSLNLKVRKHHKKLKKLKEGKIKKKKDKKDKSKKKDRLTIPSYNSDRKIKGLDKKPKKEKKKDKQVLIHIPDKAHEIPQMTLNNNIENASTQSVLGSLQFKYQN
ncbi:uncharacterized protein LOC108095031 isoform X2 [Drosophila ficusphila]|uniref:uncharacterized protein LOC108095031 isoform X2 n=1 Tax=Drosophila ficusphila TaxID=30025 RepID=UPI001C8B03A4|nr:uncharacterized protein LOC108095031 isoform X2 [Drosophila ficusphila]